MQISSLAEYLKDSLFPYFCVDCGKENEWWCKDCQKNIEPFKIEARGALDDVTALFSYSGNDSISKLIKEFKYNYVADLKDLWVELLIKAKYKIQADYIVVPVPLYSKRERERGFNQSRIIGETLAKVHGLKMNKDGLKRVRQTAQQMTLSKEERLENVKNAFVWDANIAVPKRIILVDDVYTTGATMQECAKALKNAGAERVEGLVLAHG